MRKTENICVNFKKCCSAVGNTWYYSEYNSMRVSGMSRKKGSSLLETRKRNRIYIKETIYQREPITRTDIAHELGLTIPTITTSVNEMIDEGILTETALPEEMLVNVTGRRPTGIGLIPDAAHVIGVETGPYAVRAVRMDLRGHIYAQAEGDPAPEEYKKLLSELKRLIGQVIDPKEQDKILGVAVGIPGVVDEETKTIRSIRYRDWIGKALAEDLKRSLDLPVLIGNNVRFRAVGYEMQLRGLRPDSFAYFYTSRGIACPLMAMDDTMSGYNAGPGEVGQSVVRIDTKEGWKEQVLEEVAGDEAIIAKCRVLVKENRSECLADLAAAEGALTMKQILAAQEAGDAEVNRILDEALDFLGIEIANIVNFTNPSLVVLDSYLFRVEKNRIRMMNKAKSLFFGINEKGVRFAYLPFSHYTGAVGAGYAAVQKMYLETES